MGLVQRESDSGESLGPWTGALCGTGGTVRGSAQPQPLGICHVSMSAVVPQDARGWPFQPPQPLSLGEALGLVIQLRE